MTVVATTRPMSNSSTTSKSLRQISSREYELCNLQDISLRDLLVVLLLDIGLVVATTVVD